MKKYTTTYIAQYFKEQGCELLDEYQGANILMKYRCVCGSVSMITLGHFREGKRCRNCANKKISRSHTLSFDFVKQYFQNNNCQLLSTAYVNNFTLLDYKCSCGNITTIRFSDFQQGHRCNLCRNRKAANAVMGPKHWRWDSNRERIKQTQQIHNRIGNLIHNCLKRIGKEKEGRMYAILGYSAQELWAHLSSFDNFEELERSGNWHIDHIFPVKAFIDHGITDLVIINSLDNLRPVLAFDNRSKNDWYVEDHFLQYCQKHGLQIKQKEASNG